MLLVIIEYSDFMTKLLAAAIFLCINCFVQIKVIAADLTLPSSVDVGDVKEGETRHFRIEIQNTSDKHLQIANLKTSCSCTDVKLEGANFLSPLDKRVINGGIVGSEDRGARQTRVVIETRADDGTIHSYVVLIRSRVVAAVIVQSNHVDLGRVELNSGNKSASIWIKHGDSGDAWDSIRVNAESSSLHVSVKKQSSDEFHLTFEFDPSDLPICTFNDRVRMQFYNGDTPICEKEVRVTARVYGPIKAEPASFYYGATIPGVPIERVIVITSNDLDLRALVVEKQFAGGIAEVHPSSDGREAKVVLRVTSIEKHGPFSGHLTLLHTPSSVRIEVPVLGTTVVKLVDN